MTLRGELGLPCPRKVSGIVKWFQSEDNMTKGVRSLRDPRRVASEVSARMYSQEEMNR
jgi:hypothetical protein